ncbi:IS110 family transposase [Thiocystis violacea]|uniref:IS110 family transposase n=1 Tax=Thiocystis violacea TaxID=13725 RepID=UPI00190812A0|nr:IS110 family transposase [Thiocystis violacea]MBK1720546.1 IS110 family transposase [Thiocystis violacea]
MAEFSKEPVVTLGIDLAKRSFHVYGADVGGKPVFSKKLTRARLIELMVNLPPCTVAMEACGSAHHWARLFRTFGHEIRLIAPQFVKPFVKSNKNDAADAEAICEAAQRPNMRLVAVKTVEQQDVQAIHRMRSLVVERRTAQVNQVRGLLLEYGLEVAQGRATLMRRLPEILEDPDNGLSERFRAELNELTEELRHLDARVTHYDAQIQAIAQSNQTAQRLMTIPGIGATVATALLAAVGEDPSVFGNGRGLAAWLGLVPRQHSTGGRERLLGISKRGDVYVRQLLIHGARSVMRWVERKEDTNSRWAAALKKRRHSNVAIVAMANKIARIAYAVMMTSKSYDPAIGAFVKG